MPRLANDDYVDFCVLEAVVHKAHREASEAAKEKQREDWRGKDARKQWAKEAGLI